MSMTVKEPTCSRQVQQWPGKAQSLTVDSDVAITRMNHMRHTWQKAKRAVVVTWWYGCCSGHVMSQQVINAAKLKPWFRHEHCHDVMLPATSTTPQYYYNHCTFTAHICQLSQLSTFVDFGPYIDDWCQQFRLWRMLLSLPDFISDFRNSVCFYGCKSSVLDCLQVISNATAKL